MLINAIEKKCMDLETSKTVESSYLPLQEREKVVVIWCLRTHSERGRDLFFPLMTAILN